MKRNILANFMGKFWAMISGFLFVPLYIRYLGFENYSIISFTLIISGLIIVLDAGLSATLSREFSRSDNNLNDKNTIYRTLETCYLLIGLISIIIVFSLSNVISTEWLNIPTINPALVSLYIRIFSIDIAFQMLFRFYMGGLLGLENHIKANIFQIALGLLRNGLVVIVIIFFPVLKVFFIWQCISSIIFAILIKLSLEKMVIGRYTLNFKFKINKNVIEKVWRFAGGILLISLVSAVNTQMDKLVISTQLSIETLGYYTLAVSLSNIILAFATPFSTAILPRLTKLYSSEKYVEALILFRKVGLFLSIATFSLFANMLFFSEQLFFVWTGNIELAAKAHVFVPLIAFSMSMLAIAVLPFAVALAHGYTKLNNILGIISIFITLPGYWIATEIFGGIGAAFVFCCVQTITTLVYYYFINKKFIKMNLFKSIYIEQIIKPLSISVIIVYLLQLVPFSYENSRLATFAYIGVSIVITAFTTTFLTVPIQEIKDFFSVYYSRYRD